MHAITVSQATPSANECPNMESETGSRRDTTVRESRNVQFTNPRGIHQGAIVRKVQCYWPNRGRRICMAMGRVLIIGTEKEARLKAGDCSCAVRGRGRGHRSKSVGKIQSDM